MKTPSPIPGHDFEAFLQELRTLVQRLHTLGTRLHRGEDLPSAWRTLLAALEASGPLTIPQVARHFAVSRQSVQVTVRDLEKAGLVQRQVNPDHARSHLLDLTPGGRQRLRQLRQKEEQALARLGLPLPPDRVAQTTEGLRELRGALEAVIDRLPPLSR